MDYRNKFEPQLKAQKHCRRLTNELFTVCENVNVVELKNKQTMQTQTVAIGTKINGRNDYYTVSAKLTIPSASAGFNVALKADFGKTMHGFNGGFESLLYIDDKPLCAVDTYHDVVIIPEQYCAKTVDVRFEIWTGFEGGGVPRILEHTLSCLQIGYENTKLKQLVLTIEAICQIYELETTSDELKLKYRKILELFIYELESGVNYVQILAKVEASIEQLDKNEEVELLMFGHAHIDLAWLWTLKNGREKTIRTLSTVVKYCSEYKQFRFIHSSPQIFAYLQQNEQALFAKVKQLVAEGLIEVEGGMWVEADSNLPTGESLSKQILYGKRYIAEHFGSESKVLWLPDVFGYSWAMPQLLLKSGIDTFMTTKISWNKFNKMPAETFLWKGIDGSEVLTHFMTTPEPQSKHWNKTYTAVIEADLLNRSWTSYEDKLINNKLPVAYGYGDGGGGPSREMIEQIDIYNKLPGVPKLSHTNLSSAAQALHQHVDFENISKWDGELYLEYHRGTFTTQGLIKKYNKILEVELKKLEQLIVCSNNQQYIPKLKTIWQEMLLYQFHDIIPGSSLYEANCEVIANYEQLIREVSELKANCLQPSEDLVAYNHHLNHSSDVFAKYYSNNPNITFSVDNKQVASYYFEDHHVIFVEQIDPLTSKQITFSKIEFKPVTLKANERLKTASYELEFNANGNISYLQLNGNKLLTPVELANKLVVYNDYPQNFDAWDFDIDYKRTYAYPQLSGQPTVIRNDQLVTIIENEYVFNLSTIKEQVVILHQTGALIFNHEVDWQEENKFLRSLTKSAVRACEYTAGIQYGHIKRKNNSNTSWELAQFEICAHNYVDISQTNKGLSLISDYKYGFNCEQDEIGISLLRSPKYPDHLADIGTHFYSYIIYPHQSDFNNSDVASFAYKYAHKIDASKHSYDHLKTKWIKQLGLNNSKLEISSVNYSYEQDSIIIRIAEISGGDQSIEFNNPNLVYREVRIDEKPLGDYQQAVATINFKPFAIKTFEVKYELDN